MAFKRSSVRSRSAPPPFALESLQSFGWQATFSPSRYVKDGPFGSEGCPPKPWRRGTIMKCVYLLQSLSFPTQRYVGVTTNLTTLVLLHTQPNTVLGRLLHIFALKTTSALLSLNDISKQGPDKPSRISTFGKFRLG